MKPKQKRKLVKKAVRPERRKAKALAGRIWELAEPAFKEHESARLLADYLADRGFDVSFPFESVPTALKAVKGTGRPVVGMLGEYDALPDCGEEPGTWGHACGHNLLGVGAAVGAVAAAKLLDETDTRGRVVYWGCPAEEALAGKAYMAREGAFRRMDACLCWHPSGGTRVKAAGGSALDSLLFEFHGKTAHGAYAHGGRSALDAAILMDVAVNYLREHVPENVRIHCVIRDGGNAPNVVPEYARIWYYVRAR
ncbi:MAG: amidohydrolase, partial [Planctomycetota bacterium]